MSNAILYRMPSGIPGDLSRRGQGTYEPVVLDPVNNPFSAYGLPGKVVNGKFIPVAAGDAASVVSGFLIRPYPTQTANANGTGVSTSKIGDRMRRGYMTVQNNAGTPAMDGQVYVRVNGATSGKPIGGIEAVNDATAGNTVAIPNCVFCDAGDAAGNVEIRFNI